jgi:integrase
MPDLYRRKVNGKTVWYAKLWIGGKLLTRSMATSSRHLASSRAKRMQCDLTRIDDTASPAPIKRPNLLKEEVAWKAYETWALHHKAQRTITGESQCWRQFWDWHDGNNLYCLRREHVEAWKRHMATTPGPQGRKRSPHTVNDALRDLGTVLYRLIREGDYSGPNHFASSSVERLKAPRKRPQAMNKAQVEIVLRLAEQIDRHIHLVFALGIYAGLRKGEILALQWRDIDLERCDDAGNLVGCLMVWESTDGWRPKTAGSQRIIPLHPVLRALLSHYRPIHGQGEDYIVKPAVTQTLDRKGYRWEFRKTFLRVVDNACLGDPKFNNPLTCTPHTLRRTFASQLIAAGVSPHLVKDWMGHSSITTTERSYIASRPVSLEIGRL